MAHRRSRTLLLGFHLVAVAATLPWVTTGDVVHVPQVALWFTAMAGLTATSSSPRLDAWFTRVGPVVTAALVLWLVLLTGGSASPYRALYLPVVTFMAVFRDTRAFLLVLTFAGAALVVPAAVAGDPATLATDLLLGAVVAATLLVVHRGAGGYRDTNRLYRSVLEHHAGPTYVLEADGRVNWANQPMLRLLGMELEDVVDVPWPEFVGAGEPERLLPQFLAAMEGEPQQVTIDLEGRRGRYQLRGTLFPRHRNGRVVGVMGISEDVTELHAAAFGAEALRQTLDALAIPVAIFDAGTRELLYGNGVAWWLTEARQRPDGPVRWDDLHDDLRAVLPTPGESSTVSILSESEAQPVELDVTVQHLDGRRPLLVLTGLDASDRGRRERSLLELAEAEHAAAERLRDLDRMKNAFVTAVSHELRTPVTVIVGGARSLVRLGDGGAPEARAALEDAMLRQADALVLLLSDLLDVDRLTRGTTRAEASSFDVVELVRGQVDRLPDGYPVTVDTPERLQTRADPDQVERIVAHLLQNAAKYAPGAAVTVTVSPLDDDGGFRLEVADAGPGIPPEHLDRVFEPFYRADLDHPQPGTGVGLALVAEFAAINGGSAWAEQVRDGGTRVVVEIPEQRAVT